MEAVFPRINPVTGFIQFRPEPTGTCQNRQQDMVTGFLRRIPGIFRLAPARNDEFPEGFCRQPTEYCFRNHRPGYKKYTKSFDSACLLTQFITSKHQSDDILAAECVFVFHVVKHSHNYRA
jgi:hypothetical protein